MTIVLSSSGICVAGEKPDLIYFKQNLILT